MIDAPTRKEALRQIGLKRLRPVSVSDSGGGGAAPSAPSAGFTRAESGGGASFSKRVADKFAGRQKTFASPEGPVSASGLGRRHRLPFLRSLADLVSSGMPVGDAVRLLSVRLKDPALRRLARLLWEKVSGGKSISEAMADTSEVFDRSTIYLVESGEATGNLKEILNRLVVYFEEQKELKNKIVAALAYPILLLFVACGVVLFSVFFLLPRLEGMLTALGGQMPTSTRMLVTGADFLVQYGLLILGGIALALLGWWQWIRTESGSLTWDKICLRIPVFGKFLLTSDVLQISQTMSVLLENGVTTIETLRMTENVINNGAIRLSFGEARQKVAEGWSISAALQSTGYIPQIVLDMLAVGEDTGNIVYSLKQIADMYKKDLARRLQAFIGILSVGVLMGVFLFVGFIALAIISAVFTMSTSFGR